MQLCNIWLGLVIQENSEVIAHCILLDMRMFRNHGGPLFGLIYKMLDCHWINRIKINKTK
jgi:hypothetical protein